MDEFNEKTMSSPTGEETAAESEEKKEHCPEPEDTGCECRQETSGETEDAGCDVSGTAEEEDAENASSDTAGRENGQDPVSEDDCSDPETEEDASGPDKGRDGKKMGLFGRKKDKRDEQIEELKDRVQRQMAEFDNFRKRTEREKASMYEIGAKGVVEKILPVVDNFERGLEAAGEKSEDPFVVGMQKIYKQLMTALEDLGVRPIEAVGKPFDPDFHNAVMHVEDDSVGENIITQELQKGYMYGDSVVRHSMVTVAN